MKYLPCSAAFQDSFPQLKQAALLKAQAALGAKAQASIDLEASMLAKFPTAVFQDDLGSREQTVRRCIKLELAQCEFDSLVSFQFNTGALVGSGLMKSLNKGGYRAFASLAVNPTVDQRNVAIADVEAQFAKWCRSGGKFDPGLLNRRKNEAAAFLAEARSQLQYFMTGRSPAMIAPAWRPPML